MHSLKISLIEIVILALSILVLTKIEFKASATPHTALLFPPRDLKYFSLGYQESIADLLWVRSLQDIDLCGSASEVKKPLISKIDVASQLTDSPSKEVVPDQRSYAKCEDGWSARMLDTITELAPRFKVPYMAGGTILSIVVHDNVGAAKIFKKGVERFPDDWSMSYRAAYHFMASVGDYKTAAEYLINAGKHGAPGWVFGLASKLQTRLGQAILSKPILEEAIAADPDSRWAPSLRERLDEVNKIIQKDE